MANPEYLAWAVTTTGGHHPVDTLFDYSVEEEVVGGWVGGDNGFLSRTEDGGQTWMPRIVGTKAGINDIYFRDKEAAFS